MATKHIMTFEQYSTQYDFEMNEGWKDVFQKVGRGVSKGMEKLNVGAISKQIDDNVLLYIKQGLQKEMVDGATKEDYLEAYNELKRVGYDADKVEPGLIQNCANYLYSRGYASASQQASGTTGARQMGYM